MIPRQVLNRTKTPDGASLELAIEDGFHIIRVDGVPLMSSSMRGSEEAMAAMARDELDDVEGLRVLIGGLGMGFTLRAALDELGEDTEIVVAELMQSIIEYNRGPLADLADRPMEDRRVELYHGDVLDCLRRGGWDVILMDVDNGPTALTSKGNERLYDKRGVQTMSDALNPGGVLVVWSAHPSPAFGEKLRRTGLSCETRTVRARWPLSKGPKHTLFVATRPG